MDPTANNRFHQQYIIIALNGIAVLVGVFLLNGLISRLYGIEILGEFLLIKRTVTTIVSVLLVGLNIGIPYFLNKESHEAVLIHSMALFFFYTIPAIMVFLLLIHSGFIQGFRSEHLWGYGLYTLGICIQFFAYSHFRGQLKFFRASMIQLTASALIPLLCVKYFNDINLILSSIGLINILISLLFIVLLYRNITFVKPEPVRLKKYLKYGFERYPSFISQFIILAGPGLLASVYGSYKEVAIINGNISLIRLLIFIMGPIGVIMLPKVSRIQSSEKQKILIQSLASLLELTLLFSLCVAGFLFIFNEKIISLWLDIPTGHLLSLAKYFILALPFYVMTDILRSPLDGLSQRGYNSIVYGVAAAGFILAFFIGYHFSSSVLISLGIGFNTGYIVSTLLMIYFLKKLINFEMNYKSLSRTIFMIIPYVIILQLVAENATKALNGIAIGFLICTVVLVVLFYNNQKHLKTISKTIDSL